MQCWRRQTRSQFPKEEDNEVNSGPSRIRVNSINDITSGFYDDSFTSDSLKLGLATAMAQWLADPLKTSRLLALGRDPDYMDAEGSLQVDYDNKCAAYEKLQLENEILMIKSQSQEDHSSHTQRHTALEQGFAPGRLTGSSHCPLRHLRHGHAGRAPNSILLSARTLDHAEHAQ